MARKTSSKLQACLSQSSCRLPGPAALPVMLLLRSPVLLNMLCFLLVLPVV